MDGTEFLFAIGTRVKLRADAAPSFYDGLAKAGNEGWIADRRRDPRFGLPEVYIKWDRNHWAYNRQPDQWTFQEHFQAVEAEENTMSDDRAKAARDAAMAFADKMVELFGGQPSQQCPDPVPDPVAADPQTPQITAEERAHYEEVARKAVSAIAHGEAFMVVVISRQPHPDAPQGILLTEGIGDRLSSEAEALLGVGLASAGAKFHTAVAYQLVEQYAAEASGGGTDARGPE